MHYSIEPRDICKVMDFYLLLKTWVHISVINRAKNFLIVLTNLQQMQ